MPDPEIVNVVGGGDLGIELDLHFLYDALEGNEIRYDPEHWPGLYLSFTEDSPAVLVFRTGKYNIAGASSVGELLEINEEFLSRLRGLEIDAVDIPFDIRNLVLLDHYGRELDLEEVAIALGLEYTEYEPEQFPSLFYRPPNLSGTFLIFRSGKILLTGVKTNDDASVSLSKLFDQLNNLFN